MFFNPTNTTPPFFQIFDEGFAKILGSTPQIKLLAENDTFAFAHEAPVWIPETNEVFFCSNDGGALGMSNINQNNQYSKISLQDVANLTGLLSITKVSELRYLAYVILKQCSIVLPPQIPLADNIQMTNGGTPFRGNILLINSGRGPLPSNIALLNPYPPYNSTILLDNFFGRQFNSLNDAKIHPKTQAIFFTDST